MNNFFLALIMVVAGIQSAFAEIAKEELCRTPAFISAKVSPDGTLIAKVGADEAGIANISYFFCSGKSFYR